MIKEIRVFAPAKINLGLRVLPKRKDGFHNLESIFQTVSLSDELVIKESDNLEGCSVNCNSMILPNENTITNAYKEFYNVTKLKKINLNVSLIKNIPAGGGLGGGSSDAAALIRGLEKIHGIKLGGKQLDSIASKVGSDVFFFTHCDSEDGFCAIVTGRGENIKSILKRRDLFFVLVFPDVHSSTKEAYLLVDEYLENNKDVYPLVETLESLYNANVSAWTFKNTFTKPLVLKYKEIGLALQKLKDTNPLFAEMSGSGSTIFGVYASFSEAEKAAKILNDEGLKCVVTQ